MEEGILVTVEGFFGGMNTCLSGHCQPVTTGFKVVFSICRNAEESVKISRMSYFVMN